MDLHLIKKEEPVEYALILTSDCEEVLNERTVNVSSGDVNHAGSMDIYTISIKEEPTNNWNEYDAVTHTTVDFECSEYPTSEPENLENNKNEACDEDWTVVKNASKFIKSSKSKIVKRLSCYECSASFKRKYLLRAHLKKHENLSDKECCIVCNKFYPKSVLDFHLLLHKGPPFFCATCGKKFTNKDSFRGHRKIHRERNFECDICHKLFQSKALVSSHIETHFEREKTFQCQFCNITFYRKNTLFRHIRNLHSIFPRKKYMCSSPSCNRQYVRKADLTIHKCRDSRISQPHRKVERKIYDCDQCNRLFRDPFNLVLHIKQNCSNKIMYECDMCSKMVTGKRRLISHFANYHKVNELKTVPCNLCDKKFTSGSILSTHLRAHEKKALLVKKPINLNTYVCDFCRQVFRIKINCIQHMERTCIFRTNFVQNLTTDTNSERFECDICGSVFKMKHGIVEHMKLMHSSLSFSGKFLRRNLLV